MTNAVADRDARRNRLVDELLGRLGRTYADEAGISLKDSPSPLYRLLVLCVLLSSRTPSHTGVAAARALAGGGLRTAQSVLDSTWERRVELLRGAGYRRFDERTATMLGDGAALVLDRWSGDLRRLAAECEGDVEVLRRMLQDVPGIGPVGSGIFCREVQGVWPFVGPFVDQRVQDGAKAVGLVSSRCALARLVPPAELPRLAAACVRASLDPQAADEVRRAARSPLR